MRKLLVSLLLTFSLLAPAIAQKKSAPQKGTPETQSPSSKAENLPSKATVESFLKDTFGYDPTITYQVLAIAPSRAPGVTAITVLLRNPQGQQTVNLYVLPGEHYVLVGDMMPFGADPFAPARAQIAARANGPARGPANAPVTIVEFSDLECPSCKAAQSTMEKLWQDEPDMRFIFQNFPLETMHPWAFLGATYADCLGRENPEAFWKFESTVYADQEQVSSLLPASYTSVQEAMKQAGPAIAKKLQEMIAASGGSPQQVAACAAEPATAERVRKSIKLGEDLDVTGTPTLFVNGRRIGNVNGMPYEVLKSIIDFAKTSK